MLTNEEKAVVQEIESINEDRARLRRELAESKKVIIELQERNQYLEGAIIDWIGDMQGAIE